MRLTQKFTFHCSGLPKTLSDGNRELRSYHVSVWRSRNRTASQHMQTWGCWAFPRTDIMKMSTVHMNCDGQKRCHLQGLRSVFGAHCCCTYPWSSCCWAEGTFYLGFVILVSPDVCGFFPYSLTATYRDHLRAVKNVLWDSVLHLLRADLHGCWLYRYQSKHEVTRNTCLPSSSDAETWDLKESS